MIKKVIDRYVNVLCNPDCEVNFINILCLLTLPIFTIFAGLIQMALFIIKLITILFNKKGGVNND